MKKHDDVRMSQIAGGLLALLALLVVSIILPNAETIDTLDPVTYYATAEATADPDRYNEDQDTINANLQAIGTAIQTLEDGANPYTPIYHAGAILNMSIETAAEDDAVEVGFLKYNPLTSPPTPGNGEWVFEQLDNLQATPGWNAGYVDGMELILEGTPVNGDLITYRDDGFYRETPVPPTVVPMPTQEIPDWGTATPVAARPRHNTDADTMEWGGVPLLATTVTWYYYGNGDTDMKLACDSAGLQPTIWYAPYNMLLYSIDMTCISAPGVGNSVNAQVKVNSTPVADLSATIGAAAQYADDVDSNYTEVSAGSKIEIPITFTGPPARDDYHVRLHCVRRP